MTDLQKELFNLEDKKYKTFQAALVPTINPATIIGIRVPVLRAFAKSYSKKDEAQIFLNQAPHEYYEENLLHMILLSFEKDFDTWLNKTSDFLPFIDNWAVCDMAPSKVVNKNHGPLLPHIKSWIKSDKPYIIRYGIGLLMREYLDEDFSDVYLKIVSKVKSDEYYVNMMIAWYFATALAKQWDSTIPYLEDSPFEIWTHNKIIQKAIESYRISEEHKNYLRSLKRKS